MENNISDFAFDLQEINERLLPVPEDSKQILDALNDGLFFLDSKLYFNDDYSESCKKIFMVNSLHKQNFIDFLHNKIPEKKIEETREYLELMFFPEHKENVINELNPLNEIEFHFPAEKGLWNSTKFLTFSFRRFRSNKYYNHIMVIVKDVSHTVELVKKLENFKRQSDKKIQWLLNLLYVEPSLLKEFLTITDFELSQIDSIIKSEDHDNNYDLVLRLIKRSIHHINSNASILNLDFIREETSTLKQEFDKFKQKKINNGQDFIPIIICLGNVKQLIDEIKNLLPFIKGIDNSLRTTRRFDGGLLIRSMENLIKSLTEKSGKKIIIKYHNFHSLLIPFKYKHIVNEFIIVLTRFIVEFGIENQEKRRSINLNPTAAIEIETKEQEKSVLIRYRHDGNLIRLERLLEKRVEDDSTRPKDPKSEEGSLHPGFEVLRMFFTPDISSSDTLGTTESMQIVNDLKVVKNKLRMHGGQLKVIFTSETSCEYIIILPNAAK